MGPRCSCPPGCVVDVGVADVLFVDTRIRSGWGGGFFKVEPPYVAGNGVAGTVAAAGRVTPFVGQTFPLERARDAHTALEARRTIGKTVLLTH